MTEPTELQRQFRRDMDPLIRLAEALAASIGRDLNRIAQNYARNVERRRRFEHEEREL